MKGERNKLNMPGEAVGKRDRASLMGRNKFEESPRAKWAL